MSPQPQTPACWGLAQHHAGSFFGGINVPSSSAPREPDQHQHIRVHWHRVLSSLAAESRGKSKPLPGIISALGAAKAGFFTDLKNPRGKPYSTGRVMLRNLPPSPPRCSLLAAPESRGPSGSGSTGWGPRGPGDKPWGGLGGIPVSGLAAVPASPCIRSAAAALLPQQRSGASAAASTAQGLDRGTGVTPQHPHSPGNTPWLSPQPLPTASAAPRLSLPPSWEKGDAHTAASAHPASRTGGFSTSTGHGSDELLGKKIQSGVTTLHKEGQCHIKQNTSTSFSGQHPYKGGILETPRDTQGAPREATDGQGWQEVPQLLALEKRWWHLPRAAGCSVWARN